MDNVKIEIIRSFDKASFVIGKDSNWRILKGGLDGFSGIDNNISTTDNSTTDGVYVGSTHVSKADRTIECGYVYPDENLEERKKALAFFNVKDTFKVYVTYGDRTVWAEAYLYKMAVNMTTRIKDFLTLTLIFTFPNPYWKSYYDFGKDIAALKPLLAFPYLCSIDRKPIGVTGAITLFNPIVEFYNDGDVDTYCRAVIRCTGDYVENPVLYINGEYVRVIDTMEFNDEIVIDFTVSPPTVKKNGVNFIGHCDRTSAFDSMQLVRGLNTVSFNADNGKANISVVIYYNKLYEAI